MLQYDVSHGMNSNGPNSFLGENLAELEQYPRCGYIISFFLPLFFFFFFKLFGFFFIHKLLGTKSSFFNCWSFPDNHSFYKLTIFFFDRKQQ